jgi:hypothetical protein
MQRAIWGVLRDANLSEDALQDRRIQRFLASRDAGATPARRWLAVAATLLLACGLGQQAAPGANEVAGPLADLSASWRLTAAMRRALSLRCDPAADAWLVTPEMAADHVFRGLVPVRVRRLPDGRTVHEFRDAGDGTRYELVSNEVEGLPGEIRRSPAPFHRGEAAAGHTVVTCRWETAPEPARAIGRTGR